MRTFKEFTETTFFQNPNDDVAQYVTGLFNRLALLHKEEIEVIRPKLTDLRDLIDRVLR